MDSYRWYRAYLVRGASSGAAALPGRIALAGLIALALLAFGAVAAPGRARAANPGAKITFASPIYPGQNNGSAEGPVGAQVNVQGSGWTPNANVNITLADTQGDTPNQPGTACTNPGTTLYTATTTQADGSGNVNTTFLWPSAANAKNHSYWACGDQGGNPSSPGVSYYTVLSASPPSAQINVSQAMAGSAITVTGQNWLPGNQQIGVVIAPCIACTPPYSSNAQATAKADGTFSVSVQVPTQAPAGTKLYVSVQNLDPNNPGALHTEPTNTPTLTVIAQPTATPSPTNTATPTATSTSTPTATSTASTGPGGGNGNGGSSSPGSSSGNSGSGLLIVLLSALGAVLLLAAVVAVLLFLRSRGPAPGTLGGGGPGGGYAPGGGYGQYNPPRRSGRRPPTNPGYPDTNSDYYGGPQQRGGWEDEGDEDFGDAPTIGPNRPRW